MNSYEHTFIAKQDLSDSQIKKLIEKYENIINNNQGKILKAENWGLRNLSYEIRKNKRLYDLCMFMYCYFLCYRFYCCFPG